MNVLCLSQNRGLELFYHLVLELQTSLELDKIGFYVAGRQYYEEFRRKFPDIESGRYSVVSEWAVLQQARGMSVDIPRLREYERRYGNPILWGALVADRRIYLGKRTTYIQDYRRRYTYGDMLRILASGLTTIEKLFDEIQPDFVAAFICVTFGEYLAYLVARARGIPFLDLRPTRIRNYVHFGESVSEPSERIQKRYASRRSRQIRDEWSSAAEQYLMQVRTGDARYEGVLKHGYQSAVGMNVCERGLDAFQRLIRHYLGPSRSDPHTPDHLSTMWHARVIKPIRKRQLRRLVRQVNIRRQDLAAMDYVFFPLHKEPEVTLLVYSRAYLNQIEVIRVLSHALPAGMRVLVKEHPHSVGYRTVDYYRKLAEIPNVGLVEPTFDSRLLVEHASMTAIIAGSIGFEALVHRKPVLQFGHTLFEILPQTMLRRVTDLLETPRIVHELLEAHVHDESALLQYVAAVMQESAPVNLYSTLLRRREAYTLDDRAGIDDGEAWRQDIQTLAAYTIRSLHQAGVESPHNKTVTEQGDSYAGPPKFS